jgi:hypothetical protein
MAISRNRWIESAVTSASAFSAYLLCSAVSMPPYRSLASFLLFGFSSFGIQRMYAAVVDIVIIFKRRSPEAKPSA